MASKTVKRYFVIPGYRKDLEGRDVYVSFMALLKLYDIPRNQCINAESPFEMQGMDEEEQAKLLPLRVRQDNNYVIPGRDDL